MKSFLSDFMDKNRNGRLTPLDALRTLFEQTVDSVHISLGDKPFHVRAGLNAAMFDAVFVAFAKNLGSIPTNIRERYVALTQNFDMAALTASATTDEEVVKKRLQKAEEILFG